MPREVIIYERERLYEEVWESPVTKVAKRYGVTDTALRKMCRKLGVPVPGNGYWAKLAAGKKVKPDRLYVLKEGEPTSIRVERYRDPLDDVEPGEEAAALLERENREEYRIQVEEESERLHPLVKKYAGRLRRSQKKRDMLWHKQQCLDVNATGEALERALNVANAILFGLDKRGFKAEVTKPVVPPEERHPILRHTVPSKTGVHVLGTFVEWGTEEKADVIKHEPAKKRRQGSDWMWREPIRYERIPNGQLVLRIKAQTRSSKRRNWGDGKTQRIEGFVDDFVVGLIRTAERMRIEKLDRERQHREWEERQRRYEEQRRQQQLEDAMVKDLHKRVADWRCAEEVRAFVEAVNRAARARGEPMDDGSELGDWLRWARAHADALEQEAVQNVRKLQQTQPSSFFSNW